jgi:CHRD domain-containing protein
MTWQTRPRPVTAAFAATVAVGLMGCGSAGSPAAHAKSRPTQVYTAALRGNAEPNAGSPQGRGFAIIAFHGPTTLCWRFSHLHGFATATHAAIYAGTSGRSGSLAIALTGPPRLHHRGCIRSPQATHAEIVRAPANYYVNVFAARYPRGAVRGQL